MLSKRGAEFIGRFEGFVATPYNDAVSNATIGFGHLIHYGPATDADRAQWGSITRDRGIELLQRDAEAAEHALDTYIKRPLSQCERDALISLAFNCGGGALAGGVGAAVNAHADPTTAMLQWCHAGGKALPGLLARRQAEALLFRKGVYGDGGPDAPPVSPLKPLQARYLWAAWRLGEGEFKRYGKANPKVRPAGLPKRIPAPWLAWYTRFLRARLAAAKRS